MIRISNTIHRASSSWWHNSMPRAFTGSSSDWDALHKIQKSQWPNHISNHELKTTTEKANLQEKNAPTTNKSCSNYICKFSFARKQMSIPQRLLSWHFVSINQEGKGVLIRSHLRSNQMQWWSYWHSAVTTPDLLDLFVEGFICLFWLRTCRIPTSEESFAVRLCVWPCWFMIKGYQQDTKSASNAKHWGAVQEIHILERPPRSSCDISLLH